MASKIENFKMKKVPLRSINLRSLSTANKISLKQKLTAELALVRSAIDKMEGHIPRTEQCCKRASNNPIRSITTIKQQQVPSNWKRKSTEITTQVPKKVKNANAISNSAHLNSEANPNRVLSEVTTNIDCKHSTAGALRKKHFSHSNEFAESQCEKLISPTKALRAAKLKSRFAETILKAQLELQNIGLKERALRMQREKDNLTKAYQEEQIRIEAQIKTAAAAAQKEKSELIMKIKKEREASRLALETMEATVEMNDFNQVMKELKGIGCQNISFYVLRQLGLFLKDDDFDDHKTAQISVLPNDEIEEGEICI